jgi:Ohr subfamily peroxiredoxin
MKALYTAEATTGGRNGHVKVITTFLTLQVRIPKALGGINDEYTNPEMLFAAGYAATDSALNLVKQEKISTGNVNAKISIGQLENGGFGLAAELAVNVPNVPQEKHKR